MFIREDPTPMFGDRMIVTVTQKNCTIPVDPRILELCEPGTLEVEGEPSCLQPIAIGAQVVGGKVRIRFARAAKRKVRLVIAFGGIRKGFAHLRFPSRRHDQFLANEKTINSAYPK
jgi:hypothetical protein